MIARAAVRPAIHCSYHSTSFFGLEMNSGSVQCFFVAYRENTTVLASPGHVVPEEMVHEATNGCQAAISCDGRVPALRFNMIEESENRIHLDMLEVQISHRATLLLSKEQEEELQRVSIGPYRVGACSAGMLQVAMEETFGQVQKRLGF